MARAERGTDDRTEQEKGEDEKHGEPEARRREGIAAERCSAAAINARSPAREQIGDPAEYEYGGRKRAVAVVQAGRRRTSANHATVLVDDGAAGES